MLTINDKAYTSEYVAKAIEAFANPRRPTRHLSGSGIGPGAPVSDPMGDGGGRGHRWGVSLPAG